MNGGDLEVMRVKLRMDGFNAIWRRLTSSQVFGFSRRESNADVPGWRIAKCVDGPDITPEAAGAVDWKGPPSWEGCCWMLLGAAMLYDVGCCRSTTDCSFMALRWTLLQFYRRHEVSE